MKQSRANPVMGCVETMSNPTKTTDPKEWTKRISYMSTFDGGLYRRGKGNAQFIMNMRAANRDYMEWVKETLECVTPARLTERKDYNTDQLRLESTCHPKLTAIHDRVYIQKHKVIDPHMLKLMDAEALAIIFMCDGGTQASLRPRSVTPSPVITLNTKGFSWADNMALSKAIYQALGIRTNVSKHGKYWYLTVPVKDAGLFVETVEPYVLPSFRYKLERLAPCVNHIKLRKGDEIVQHATC